MSLTYDEEVRLEELETTVAELQTLVQSAASEKMLNKLLTLCNEENRKTRIEVEEVETKLDDLISLAEKLQ